MVNGESTNVDHSQFKYSIVRVFKNLNIEHSNPDFSSGNNRIIQQWNG